MNFKNYSTINFAIYTEMFISFKFSILKVVRTS